MSSPIRCSGAVEVPFARSTSRSGSRRCSSAPSRSRSGGKRCRSSSACSRSRTACSLPASQSCRTLPVIAELAAAVDVPVITLVVGLLTRRIHATARHDGGRTAVGVAGALSEPWNSQPSSSFRRSPAALAVAARTPLRRSDHAGASAIVLALAAEVALEAARAGRVDALDEWLTCDGLGALVLLLVAFVGFTAALFSWGYIASRSRARRRTQACSAITGSTICSSCRCSPSRCWRTSR